MRFCGELFGKRTAREGGGARAALTNVPCMPVELELCTERGHAIAYFSQKPRSHQKRTTSSNWTHGWQQAVDIAFTCEASASCASKLCDLYASVQGVDRLISSGCCSRKRHLKVSSSF